MKPIVTKQFSLSNIRLFKTLHMHVCLSAYSNSCLYQFLLLLSSCADTEGVIGGPDPLENHRLLGSIEISCWIATREQSEHYNFLFSASSFRVGVIKIVIVINCNLITFSKVIACNCN